MKFRTEVEIEKAGKQVTYESNILFVGSCFSENIGEKCTEMRLPTFVNPFGIIYNPVSVRNSLDFIVDKKTFTAKDLFWANDQWNSFYHHSRFSGATQDETLNAINTAIAKAHTQLKTATHLFVTFGTAWVFEHKEKNFVVSNNHKLPGKLFKRFRLSTEQIVEQYSELIKKLLVFNPALNIVFTVSPVRHLKDGAHGNQLSKATLLLATEELCQRFGQAEYFPAYEFFMDDLRDYRFYADDLTHPNSQGVEYVWEKFQECFIADKERIVGNAVGKINRAMQHRLQNENSESSKRFVEHYLKEVKDLVERFPFLDLTDAVEYFTMKNKKI